MSTDAALAAALAATAGLVALHLVAPLLRRLKRVPERVVGSFAGGLAVSYVFLHLLPELAEGSHDVGVALEDVLEPTPLLELALFSMALLGFLVFYGLERLAEHSPGSQGVAVPDSSADEPSGAVYWVHLASYAGYNALITYTLPLRFRTGAVFAVLFAIAIGLHFVLSDRGLAEHYPQRFARWGRWVLAAALLAGWLLALTFAPTSTLVVSLLTALLAGSILLNVFKEELPDAGARSSFPWFLTGALLYAILLIAVTAASA
jgi:hypothetical protein